MALTGELSDLSLAELIEFFCNQRKTGRLKVIYPIGPGFFYLQSGSVVHARIGVLRGIEAVYYALTLSNASFTFSPAFEAPEQTINQPWTSVVLEGLRRMDEGAQQPNAFPDEEPRAEEIKPSELVLSVDSPKANIPDDRDGLEKGPIDFSHGAMEKVVAFLAGPTSESRLTNRPWTLGAVVSTVVLILAVIGIPWGWRLHNKAAKPADEKILPAENTKPFTPAVAISEPSAVAASSDASQATINSDTPDLVAKRQREALAKERAKAQEAAAAVSTQSASKETSAAVNPSNAKSQSSPSTGSKRVTVQVTYDENGRVTQASGGDATALRIARQKRFPAGKAGSATITIPIN